MLSRVAEIAELVGQWRSTQSSQVPMLRRENRIRTIQASLAIEHNTLSLDQVTAVIDGKPVLGLPREIQEVRNAFAAYEAMSAGPYLFCRFAQGPWTFDARVMR